VRSLLYVHLINSDLIAANNAAKLIPLNSVSFTPSVRQFITDFYVGATNVQRSLQVRFLVGNICSNISVVTPPGPQVLHHSYDVILTDASQDLHRGLTDYVRKQFPASHPVEVVRITSDSDAHSGSKALEDHQQPVRTHRSVCLGGTFDIMHVGHYILLTEGCLLADQSLLVGVTDGQMNENKVLSELMLSTDKRVEAVRSFVTDIKPRLQYNIVPINDPFGPPITEPNFDCIVVSRETVRGGDAINKRRLAQGMHELTVEVIELVADLQHSADEEEKVSSSSARKRLLGTLLKPAFKATSSPYIIGLTGSTASGKSSVCKRLERLGAVIVE